MNEVNEMHEMSAPATATATATATEPKDHTQKHRKHEIDYVHI